MSVASGAERFEVPGALVGERVDRAVAVLTGRSRSEVAAALSRGEVVLDGSVVRTPSERVRLHQVIEASLALPIGPPVADPEVPVTVVYADDDLLVVDKPAGQAVHPGAGRHAGTLVSGLLARFPELAGVGEAQRPGLVHRLDIGTSGLLVVARNEPAREALSAQLAAREVSRRYTCLVLGTMPDEMGVVDAPIGRSRRDPTSMAVDIAGRPARTRYEVTARSQELLTVTLLRCSLETGRTHQVRVHMRALGHPVAGDDRYGGSNPILAELGLSRPFLHASELALTHPRNGEEMKWSSPLPTDLGAVLEALGFPQHNS